MSPPPYPRTPYLYAPEEGARDDAVLAPAECLAWLNSTVRVEEKLDGANVSLWQEGGRLEVASRGGPAAMDRGKQLGRLRAWAAEHSDRLHDLTDAGWVMYGEWLWLTHTVHYDRLPDYLVVLDLWHPDHDFAPPEERDGRCTEIGLACPPTIFTGVLRTADRLVVLLGQSAFSTSVAMEGAVLRSLDHRRCKVLRPGLVRRSDESWSQRRLYNRLAPVSPAASPRGG